MRLLLIFVLFSVLACAEKKDATASSNADEAKIDLVAILDTIWKTEQTPIRLRDSLMKVHGVESAEAEVQQKIYKKNHAINEKKVVDLLAQGWPDKASLGGRGNLTICNVLQHSSMDVRLKYLPMMRDAVKAEKLEARLLARAEDRLATDRGELQIYGGQIKYYPATKSFDVWPIFDPENVDKRRAAIGLEPMAEFLKSRRTPMEWNLEEQLKRTAAFQEEKKNTKK